jgi:hypothetical protein
VSGLCQRERMPQAANTGALNCNFLLGHGGLELSKNCAARTTRSVGAG